MIFRLFPVVLVMLFQVSVTLAADALPRPTVGAIRWDVWFPGNVWQKNLGPKQWHNRLPFYGKELSENEVEIVGSTQEVMDQEIAFAQAAGLNYWAFLYHHPQESRYNYGLRLYLSSRRKADIHFSVIIYPRAERDWLEQSADVARLVAEPTYQKVASGRPLIYLMAWEKKQMPEALWGTIDKQREAIGVLRNKIIEAGQKTPYIVVQAMNATNAARCAEQLGLDAVSTYANWTKGNYADLTAVNRRSWEEWKATGKKVVPLLSAGWDPRPRNQPGAAEPTPVELRDHVRSALGWVDSNKEAAEARTILIYAWNESDEGGWLVPTKSEGTARLDAIRDALRGHAPAPRDDK